jgi:hypothetical protein
MFSRKDEFSYSNLNTTRFYLERGDNVSINTLCHQYNSLAALLYFHALTAVNNFFELLTDKIAEKKDMQQNALPIWIVVLIVLIAGGLVLAGLIWACNKFGGGRTFAGEFRVVGVYVQIKCF